MPRYTKKDKDGLYYIESVNGKLYSNIFGHTYGEAIDRLAELENSNVVPRAEVERLQSQVNRLKKYDEERDIRLHARLIANAKSEVAREIFSAIQNAWETTYYESEFEERLAKLEKKYTDQKGDEGK